jgi:hypothetical protein
MTSTLHVEDVSNALSFMVARSAYSVQRISGLPIDTVHKTLRDMVRLDMVEKRGNMFRLHNTEPWTTEKMSCVDDD